jgi:hypothetical protein
MLDHLPGPDELGEDDQEGSEQAEANLSLLKSGKVQGVRFATLEAICRELDCQPGDLRATGGLQAVSRARMRRTSGRRLRERVCKGIGLRSRGANAPRLALPMQRASGRWLVSISFRRPDGGERRALAWLNMGAPAPVLSKELYRELGPGRQHGLDPAGCKDQVEEFLFADAPGSIDDGPSAAAGLLRHFVVTVDPGAATLTLARPGTQRPRGVPVPIRVNPVSGIAVADAWVITVPVGSRSRSAIARLARPIAPSARRHPGCRPSQVATVRPRSHVKGAPTSSTRGTVRPSTHASAPLAPH